MYRCVLRAQCGSNSKDASALCVNEKYKEGVDSIYPKLKTGELSHFVL